jgi:hypothetical protein
MFKLISQISHALSMNQISTLKASKKINIKL